jgi:hypothetical protein
MKTLSPSNISIYALETLDWMNTIILTSFMVLKAEYTYSKEFTPKSEFAVAPAG